MSINRSTIHSSTIKKYYTSKPKAVDQNDYVRDRSGKIKLRIVTHIFGGVNRPSVKPQPYPPEVQRRMAALYGKNKKSQTEKESLLERWNRAKEIFALER